MYNGGGRFAAGPGPADHPLFGGDDLESTPVTELKDWLSYAAGEMGIEAHRIPVVILSAIGIYLAFLLLVRLFTPRVLAQVTIFDAVVLVMFGAVAGRVVIGHPPSLAAGVIGLATLMVMEAIFGGLRSTRGFRALLQGSPVLIVAHGEIVTAALRRTRLTSRDIHTLLRRAGIGSLSEVQAVIAEPTGDISVFRVGQPLDEEALRDVIGAERLK